VRSLSRAAKSRWRRTSDGSAQESPSRNSTLGAGSLGTRVAGRCPAAVGLQSHAGRVDLLVLLDDAGGWLRGAVVDHDDLELTAIPFIRLFEGTMPRGGVPT
jgi:hypothetical protein